ncbi:MAG: tRNA (guanosine(37)-N1)-methyltransferase TrmD [Candidatus Niyogibacteria bacterium RIFCSPLOWO2_12_FULL_41_13]|uniref:tRNA (guanine-N(1)-)-methyltransferase n=1 Tax=Candidatus Niyogibacteria bacterium RIFCSPLOWO2_12_FULL_41_13 TaxID=1801726 RepID=A0A1G2F3E6_9BACT|nr:MAG: tRNA (guanosine(37)-N1)-methyltransferase TrmD [Candidatus Niyogibacteria bacterium RIFCSPLOWO2_12_FULL_41_13]
MKNFHIITIFPESFDSYLNSSILSRAKNKFLKVKFYNPRDFTSDKRRKVDTRPYGGEPGMVMQVEPIVKAADKAKRKSQNANSKIIIFSPRGKTFNQKMARNFAEKYDNFILICGRYEGIDERVKKILKAEEVSTGDYVLTGGELPAMVFIDALVRHIPGVLGKYGSLEEIKGSYPVYTRPEIIKWKNKKYAVPKILLSGHHKKIKEWREKRGKKV